MIVTGLGLEVARHALSYMGTPFEHQGRRPGQGLDCAGIVVCAYRASGFPAKDRTDYRVVPRWEMLRDLLEENLGRPVSLMDTMPGDVLVMRFDPRRDPCHLGVFVGDGRVVSVEHGTTVRVEGSGRWADSAVCAYGTRVA